MNKEIIQTVVVSALLGALCYGLLRSVAPGGRTAVFVGIATVVFAVNYFIHLNYKRIARSLAGQDEATIDATLDRLNPKERRKVLRRIEILRDRA